MSSQADPDRAGMTAALPALALQTLDKAMQPLGGLKAELAVQ
jgi:hypothetical protein